jgi:hypothetical protein
MKGIHPMGKTFALAAALILLAALPAQALPAAPVQTTVSVSDVTLIAGGCGRGWYRDRYGRCRRSSAVYVAPSPYIVAPPVVVAPAPRVIVRSCPRGTYRNRYGRCVWY